MPHNYQISLIFPEFSVASFELFSFTQITLDQEEADGPEDDEEFINFNFSLQELDSRQLVNSWNIKDPL